MRVLSVVLFLMLSAGVTAERYEVVVQQYEQKQYDLAYQGFLELAMLGNKDAQFNLGLMYVNGHSVPVNDFIAYAWIGLSATQGRQEYKDVFAELNTLLTPEQRVQGENELAKLTLTYGDEIIAEKLYPHLGVGSTDGNYKRYLVLSFIKPRYPKAAAKSGLAADLWANFIVAADGRVKYPIVTSFTSEMFIGKTLGAVVTRLYRPAEINGRGVDVYSVHARYVFVVEGKKGKKGKKAKQPFSANASYQELSRLKEKAKKGSSYDRYLYANATRILGEYLPKDTRKEFGNTTKWFQQSAVDGLPLAKYELGRSLLHGEQCDSDFDKSYFWLESAAKDGLVEAQLLLGMERFNGVRFSRDEAEGVSWLSKAAEQGHDPASIELALALVTAQDTTLKDPIKALNILQGMEVKKVIDKITYYEVLAIVYAVNNDQKNKGKALKRLKKEAQRFVLPFDMLAKNIENRLAGKPIEPLVKVQIVIP